jgi:hypothetical protein
MISKNNFYHQITVLIILCHSPPHSSPVPNLKRSYISISRHVLSENRIVASIVTRSIVFIMFTVIIFHIQNCLSAVLFSLLPPSRNKSRPLRPFAVRPSAHTSLSHLSPPYYLCTSPLFSLTPSTTTFLLFLLPLFCGFAHTNMQHEEADQEDKAA